jgi:hypothetical protein
MIFEINSNPEQTITKPLRECDEEKLFPKDK